MRGSCLGNKYMKIFRRLLTAGSLLCAPYRAPFVTAIANFETACNTAGAWRRRRDASVTLLLQ